MTRKKEINELKMLWKKRHGKVKIEMLLTDWELWEYLDWTGDDIKKAEKLISEQYCKEIETMKIRLN